MPSAESPKMPVNLFMGVVTMIPWRYQRANGE